MKLNKKSNYKFSKIKSKNLNLKINNQQIFFQNLIK